METVTLKLVGAQTYVGPRTKDKIIRKGETYDFSAKDAEAVLKEFNKDALGNEYPLFKEVAGAARQGDGGGEAKTAETVKAQTRKRVARSKAAQAGEEEE